MVIQQKYNRKKLFLITQNPIDFVLGIFSNEKLKDTFEILKMLHSENLEESYNWEILSIIF
jgi:hypothetical protein